MNEKELDIMKGFDCASTVTLEAAKKFIAKNEQNGYEFVLRYLAENWKGMKAEEAKMLLSVGLKIGTVYEKGGHREDLVGANGITHGRDAYRIAKNIGQPIGTTIYFAVDYEALNSDMNNIEAYLRAAATAIPGYNLGVYGSYYVIEAMKARGVCNYFWQTVAWSNRKISKYANILQSAINITKNGIGIDENTSYGNEGFWGERKPAILSQTDSDLITAGLGALWELGVTKLGDHNVNRDQIHRLADVVRAAIGKSEVSVSKADEALINAGLGALWNLHVTSLKGKPVNKDIIHRLANVVRKAAGVPLQ
jgi:hypothetical protein